MGIGFSKQSGGKIPDYQKINIEKYATNINEINAGIGKENIAKKYVIIIREILSSNAWQALNLTK